ncbi:MULTISPECIES: ABC transporter ATP-binding protein [Haloferax]|uniref:Molybdate/tungstate import ATP-binding protein WtpC n=4 Tax=Haloferax TaxID=2251 RepID=A0A384KS82_HALVD|nr:MULTISPECIES: ABC transporter ATP-binding protein [Haloferax]ADE02085.1 ABC-type transport system ATP-binding protein [Haloferax volcanii DS2]ELY31414.1 spermidine/putrescine ABC transporter substrate-binding protein [Haloferax volcanii DS2]MBS8120772.1 ABC transporter ATP-binding protein [Haloferax volcanii]MBS8125809.1 ABC transporter ATP-binding protein [Haloferax volcanii]MBS8129593.1 ABC transporter ATP-binding protein [Haloferax volcanii]
MATSDHTHADEASAGLSVDGLTKIYPDGTLAVDDISFSIDAGDFCVIIGPSGCGKSTTLHSLVGNVPPTKGTVTLDGRDITDAPTYRRDIGLVFQDFQLFPHLTVEENIRYGLERMDVSAAEADDHVASMAEMMQLEGMLDRDPAELSAGQQQRVALARSLVLEPKLLLLDEPLGDMDYKLQKRMERELLRLHRELETTFVYVTHDQTQAMRLADQMVVMNDGQIEHSGPVREVYNRPRTAFTAAFVGDSNLFSGTVTDVDAGGAVAVVDTDFGAFRVSTANADSKPENLVDRSVVFAVRPQFVRLEDGENGLDCDVDDVIHRSGEGTQIVMTARGSEGTKQIQAKSDDRVEPAADAVTVGWNADDAILLERTSVAGDVDLQEDILGE